MNNARYSIVIVDDTPENIRLLAQLLSEQGYRVRSAPNGERALATVRKERPDLILLDILMPGIDGYEVCRQLKADEQFKNIPVIFISALNEAFDKVSAFSVGAVDYVTKPFQVEEVLARVQTHLSIEHMRQQLEAQNHQLQEQNGELEAFAHTVAHDLKNPLSIILGALELLHTDDLPLDEDQIKMLSISLNASYKMDSIIRELLLLASVRKEDVDRQPIMMGGVVQQAFTRLSHMTDRYHPQILLPDAWPNTVGYAPWVEEVWVNYLSNAMKYGGEPPVLRLQSDILPDGMVCFSVIDNGAGLNESARASLFTEFTRLNQARAEGHGLGLSIVRRIMDKLDGTCGVESVLGEGSQFYFMLPADS
jgi:two-component system sensor histidine kinase/response regulator